MDHFTRAHWCALIVYICIVTYLTAAGFFGWLLVVLGITAVAIVIRAFVHESRKIKEIIREENNEGQ